MEELAFRQNVEPRRKAFQMKGMVLAGGLGWSCGYWAGVQVCGGKQWKAEIGREGGAECNGLKLIFSPRANLGH